MKGGRCNSRNVQYSAPTASVSAADPDPDVDVGASDVDVGLVLLKGAILVLELALVLVLESTLKRVDTVEDVAGMSPSRELRVEDADSVPGESVRACERDVEEPSPMSRPGRGEGAAVPKVARAMKERKTDVNFMSTRKGKEAKIKFKMREGRTEREKIQPTVAHRTRRRRKGMRDA